KHDGHSYRIDKSIRDMCVFARHNVTADPPFSHVDLISCRNVLIYLSTPLQKRIFPTFHYALNPTGFLVLGTAETVGGKTDLFELVDRASKIYAKKPTNARLPLFYSNEGIKGLPKVSARSINKPAPEPADYHREADRLLLGKYSPAGVLINEDFEVIQYRGGTSAYLEAPHGEPTTNVLKLAREGIFLPLRSAVNEARNRNKPVRRDGVQLRSNGTNREIALEVVPVKLPGAQPACFLVLFHDAADQTPAPIPSTKSRKPAANEKRGKQLDFIRLQQELAATKEYLQSLAEQQDAANEELRSANEEILSSNEELQSTNEELETAKEELQSANEELTTVNEQLQHRNVELSQLNNDMNNLMSSTHIPVVMVGTDLRIRRFTQPAKKIMNLLPGDIGRPISDIKGATSVADLDKLVQSVIETVQPQERVAQDRNGRWLSLRVTPYRTDDNRIDGAVLLLVDVDTQKKAEEVLREADRRKDEFLATLAHELRNPISPIVNAVETMRLAEHDAITTAEAREVLYRQVHQLSRIVEDMIDVSRIVEKKVELKRELVTLSTVVDIAVESCRSQMAAHRHHFKLELPDEPVFLYADPVRIAQILLNVLRNASKFTPPDGQIWLSAELERSQSDSRGRLGRPGPTRGMEVVIRIGDTGIGMTSELLPHVFDMFAQGDHRDSLGGLGVGLSLVRALVELHNGEVEAFSPGPDKGSEIVIRLPVVTDSADREPEQQNDTLTLASPTL
ncbi:MAG TPA: PAS domain-containing protein, partial [Pyrinomonadaceae bacterium]